LKPLNGPGFLQWNIFTTLINIDIIKNITFINFVNLLCTLFN
jgi:hypothetical protein